MIKELNHAKEREREKGEEMKIHLVCLSEDEVSCFSIIVFRHARSSDRKKDISDVICVFDIQVIKIKGVEVSFFSCRGVIWLSNTMRRMNLLFNFQENNGIKQQQQQKTKI